MEINLTFKRRLLKMGLVSIKDFIKYAKSLQDIILLIGNELDPRIEPLNYDLLIKDHRKGSEVYSLVPRIQTSIYGATAISKAVETLSNISDILDEDVEGNKHKDVVEVIKNPANRRAIFKKLDKLTKPGDFEISLKETKEAEPRRIYYPTKQYKKSIKKWQKLELVKREETIMGALTVLHGEKDKFFAIRDTKGNYVRYRYVEAEEKNFYPLFKKVVKITGLFNPIKNEIEKIKKQEAIDKINLNNIKDLEFKYPLTLDLEFKFDAFFVSNEDLNLIAAGKTFKEMYDDLYFGLVSHIEYFINTSEELTPSAQKIKLKLIDLIDLKNWEG